MSHMLTFGSLAVECRTHLLVQGVQMPTHTPASNRNKAAALSGLSGYSSSVMKVSYNIRNNIKACFVEKYRFSPESGRMQNSV